MAMNWNKLRGLAASGRIANLPSVASNVFVGIAVAAVQVDRFVDRFFWQSLIILVGAATCLYLAANFLNDRVDLEWDSIHRPERALPSGLFTTRFYTGLACFFALAGLVLSALIGLKCVLISVMILCLAGIYTYWHKKSAWSVIAMGMCRALLPLLGFYAIHDELKWIWPMAVGLFCYIVGLSMSARYEGVKNAPRRMKYASRILFCTAAIVIVLGTNGMMSAGYLMLYGVLPYVVWVILCVTVFGKTVSSHVSNLLAGIPLLDWIVLLPLGLGMEWVLTAGNFLPIACLFFPPLAFLGGKLLQRFAPAS